MKKLIGLGLVCIMVLSMIPTALATTDYTNGTLVKYVGTGDAEYTITVPALLAPGGEGNVTLKGTWASDSVITVSADKTVTLTNSINPTDQKTLDVTFDGISQAGDNTKQVQAVEVVSVSDISNALFGIWNGKFNYNVEMTDNKINENKNDCGLYLNAPYVALLNTRYGEEENKTNPSVFIAYEDGSMRHLQNGVEKSFPAGFITESNLSALGVTVLENGESLLLDGDVYHMKQMEDLEINDIECIYNGYNNIDIYVYPNTGIMKNVDIEIVDGQKDGLTFWEEYDENGIPTWRENSWAFYNEISRPMPVPGTYTVKVTVEDHFGNILTDTVVIEITETN